MSGSSTALQWFKSSYSSGEGGACLEMAYAWRKSSYSGDEGGACLEFAAHPTSVHIRDSKNREGPHFTVAPDAWTAFLSLTQESA
ncbi:DUF397 domain-containing protein [Streptomyces sp. NPDC003032]